jgi:hypothetical protein
VQADHATGAGSNDGSAATVVPGAEVGPPVREVVAGVEAGGAEVVGGVEVSDAHAAASRPTAATASARVAGRPARRPGARDRDVRRARSGPGSRFGAGSWGCLLRTVPIRPRWRRAANLYTRPRG